MPSDDLPQHGTAPTQLEVQALAKALPLLRQPYALAVSKHADRRRSGLVHCSVASSALPPRSFLRTALGIYVSRAPLAFLQVAPVLPLPHLIELGYALCSHYAFAKAATGIALEAAALVDASTLASYAEAAKSMRGAKQARRAARYVLDGSNSPVETLLAMLLTLPLSLGGYALPAPPQSAADGRQARRRIRLAAMLSTRPFLA